MGFISALNVGAGGGNVGWWNSTTGTSTVDLPSFVRSGDIVIAICCINTGSTAFTAPSGSWTNLASQSLTPIFGAGRLDIFRYTYATGDAKTSLSFTPASASAIHLGLVRSDQGAGSVTNTIQTTDDTNTADTTITVPSLAITNKNSTMRWLFGITTNQSFEVSLPTSEATSADNPFGTIWTANTNTTLGAGGLRVYTKADAAQLDTASQAWVTGGTAKDRVIQMNFDDGSNTVFAGATQVQMGQALVNVGAVGLDHVVIATDPGSGSGISVY